MDEVIKRLCSWSNSKRAKIELNCFRDFIACESALKRGWHQAFIGETSGDEG